MEPHDYRIYYVNIDLRHQYGISVAESQTFLRAKSLSGEERGETDVFAANIDSEFRKNEKHEIFIGAIRDSGPS